MPTRSWPLLSLLGLLLLSCSDDSDRMAPALDRLYFPLEIGDFRIYEITDINLGFDTTSYQLKETVVDTFTTVPQGLTYILHRFTRPIDSDPWKLDSVWTARLTELYAVVVENNVPLAKVHFPLTEGLKWDGNRFNHREEEIYEIVELNAPFSTDVAAFSNTLMINERNQFDSLIFKDIRQSVYAWEVGLIFKHQEFIDFCGFVECLGEIESGRIFKQTLIDFGNE